MFRFLYLFTDCSHSCGALGVVLLRLTISWCNRGGHGFFGASYPRDAAGPRLQLNHMFLPGCCPEALSPQPVTYGHYGNTRKILLFRPVFHLFNNHHVGLRSMFFLLCDEIQQNTKVACRLKIVDILTWYVILDESLAIWCFVKAWLSKDHENQ